VTAPAGAIIGIYVDLVARVHRLDVIEMPTGRRYQVIAVRVQERGLHRGRQHLRCLVLAPMDDPGRCTPVHRIAWYQRGRKRARR
jgi:hypothetical protein